MAGVERIVRDLFHRGDIEEALKLVREKLVESFKNGIAASKRRATKAAK